MISRNFQLLGTSVALAVCVFVSCNENKVTDSSESLLKPKKDSSQRKEYISQPLVKHIYTADPSAHLFNGRIYIYPSHDTSTSAPQDDVGSHFDMRDYHILSMDSIGAPVTDHGVALQLNEIPWALKQLWAPDIAYGKWWLFYHDTQLSGKTHLRNVKVTELSFNADGSIQVLSSLK